MTHARFPSFWRFALGTYRKPGVEAACLALQDEAGADIPVILLLLYAGRAGCGVLTHADLRRIIDAAEPWATGVVNPLRQVRRTLKKPASSVDQTEAETLRVAIKQLELQAERIQMAALVALLPDGLPHMSPAARRRDVQANIAAYMGSLPKAAGDKWRVMLNTLIDAAAGPGPDAG